jgi:hypothetical protein
MKVLTVKYVFGILAAVLFGTAADDARAQILTPGEIIYSRAATVEGDCSSGAIWAAGQDGSNDRFITQGHHPRISPDGRYLMFKRFNGGSLCSPFNLTPQWWIRDLGRRSETQIAQNLQPSSGHFFSPETNRDGRQIIFSDGAGICGMSRDGSNKLCSYIPNLDPIRGAGHPVVRGTDYVLLVQNFMDNADGGLYTLDYYTLQNRQKIPNTVGRDLNPSWSNEGTKIAFATYPTTRAEPYFFTNVFKINEDGSNRTQLTSLTPPNGEGFSYSLVWTKDNSAVINAAKLNGVAGIYKIATDGSGAISQIPITPGAAPEWVGGIAPVYSEQQVGSFGGGVTGGGDYQLVDTIGQAFAGQTSGGGGYNLQSGFWESFTSRKSPFDFDGDGKTDIGIFRPSNGEWWIQRSSTQITYALQFGAASDKIVPADYTGDGKTDVAFFRPSTGFWFILRSGEFTFYSFPFGANGDIPVAGDFNADGKADAGVFRPSNGTWYILQSNGGTLIQSFGQNGDVPVVADYDGDSKADIAIYRVASGEWWIQRSSLGIITFQFGNNTDKPVQGDYTGDGKADVAFYRPVSGEWFILRSENQSYYSFSFGSNGDVPVAGDYDGDGTFDAAVFRPSGSTWYAQRSVAGTLIQSFGQSGDVPVPNAFVP